MRERGGRYSTMYDFATAEPQAAAQHAEVAAWEVHTGYLRDELNTDNAWKETALINYHDNSTQFATCFNLLPKNRYRWTVADENIDFLLDRHRESLTKVTEHHGAFFTDKMSPVFKQLLALIERNGLRQQGLYRLSGSSANIKALLADACLGKTDGLSEVNDVHELTGLFKMILREMTPPLLTFSHYDECLECGRTMALESVQALFALLPMVNVKLLLAVVRHLKRVEAEAEFNKMTLDNISLVFGPTMIRSPDGLAGDLRDHKLQCQAAKTLLGCSTEELNDIEQMCRNRNAFAEPKAAADADASPASAAAVVAGDNAAATSALAGDDATVVVRRRKSRDPAGSQAGMRKRAASCSVGPQAGRGGARGGNNRRVYTLSEQDCKLWEKSAGGSKLSKLSSLRSSETASSVADTAETASIGSGNTGLTADPAILATLPLDASCDSNANSADASMGDPENIHAPRTASAREVAGSPEGFEDEAAPSSKKRKSTADGAGGAADGSGVKVLSLNDVDEDGLPVGCADIDDDTLFDEDGLPISAAVCDVEEDTLFDEDGLPISAFEPTMDDDGKLIMELGLDSTGAVALRNKAHLKPLSDNRISRADLCMIASPARKTKKTLKVSSLAASYDTRKAGYAHTSVRSTMKRRYLQLQGSMLKIYKTCPKSAKPQSTLRRKPKEAEYLNMSADTTITRISKLELDLHFPLSGTTRRLRLTNEVEAEDWMRVLQNSARILENQEACDSSTT